MTDTRKQDEIEHALRASEARNRALLGQVIEAQEKERARVARELHDATGQALRQPAENNLPELRGAFATNGYTPLKTELRIPHGSSGFGGFAQIRSVEIREIRLIRVEISQWFPSLDKPVKGRLFSAGCLSSLLFGLRAVIEATSLEAARNHAKNLHRLAGQALEDVQRLARGLRPAVLDDFGLVPALQRIAEDHRMMQGLDIRIDADEIAKRRFPAVMETTAYRIAQEALTNVAKHARAAMVTLSLDDSESMLKMTIRDDGRGFDVHGLDQSADRSRHFGVNTMRERTLLAGGKFSIESAPGRGTTICVELPST